ncbi:hypothetical protein ACWYXO_17950 [Janthinobacterium aestuarii]
MKSATINLITKFLTTLAEHAPKLVPLLQVLAIIIGMGIIGLMIWKGKP